MSRPLLIHACLSYVQVSIHLKRSSIFNTYSTGFFLGHICKVLQTKYPVIKKSNVFFSRFVMKYLEMNGVNFNAVDKNLQTALHICCVHGHVDAFKFLIKAEVIFMKRTLVRKKRYR